MFDLSMQSALDIFCYVLVLIYGLALSADISTGAMSPDSRSTC